jgi:uncharacterized protein
VIRVVVDAGVVISAMIAPRGTPARVFDLWMDGAYDLVVSPGWLREFGEVVDRPRIAERITPAQASRLSSAIARGAVHLADPDPTPGITPDPDDDYLVALARAAGARFLVSGDTHLLGLADATPPILTPRQFLDVLGG